MGFFDFLNSGTKVAENASEIGKTLTEGVVSGLDALVFTDEEKTQYSAKAGELYLKFYEAFGKENSEQSKARRELAKMTFKVFFFLLLAGIALYKVDANYAMFCFKTAESVKWLVGMVAAAYFIPHQISKVYTNKK